MGIEPIEVTDELASFRVIARRWLETTLLPIDQMILTVGQDLFTEPADLALAHKLALVLRHVAEDHSDWRLPELTQELNVIARNERKFIGFSNDDGGFDPERYRGKVVVCTMHKAKGLEWDKVYLASVNNYDFPSLQQGEIYRSEKYFLRGGINLEAEVLQKMEALINGDIAGVYLEEGLATQQARFDYASERLRLLYVGITRARRELVITWNSGRGNNCKQALAVQELKNFIRGAGDDPTG